MFRRAAIWMVLGLVLVPSWPAMAAPLAPPPPKPQATPPGQGLEISPPVIELNADPGQNVSADIKLRNVAGGDLITKGKADDFGAKGEDGQPQILLDEQEATRYSLKFWIASVPSLRLVPKEVKTVSVAINVPANAEPGGHYGVIRFTATPPELEGTGVALSASIGALILLKVSGEITEKLTMADFFASHNGHRGSWFESGPLTLVERIKNEGSVHEKPVGTIEVFDTFHRKMATLPLNDPPHNILPDSTRRFEQTLNKKFLFGRYRVRANITYGTAKQALPAPSLVIWVIPYKLIGLIILVLLLVFLVLRRLIRGYNRRIIARSHRR